MLLRKNLSLSDVRLTKKEDGMPGRYAGYASVFGGVDSYGDTIIKGAFESTLRTNGKPKMFFDHDWSMPIARIDSAKEDDHGLHIEWEMTPGMSKSADVQAALEHGTLDGLSIGGYVKAGDYDETENGRVIRRWANLMEVSVVAFPADTAARVAKGADFSEVIEELRSLKEIERFLRDAGGFSKGAATALVARAKAVLGVEGDPDAATAEAKAIAQVTQRLQALQQLLST
jgi:uncharacterized protein